jgi:hypothetical protein
MNVATIGVRSRFCEQVSVRQFELAPGYGQDAATAHNLLTLALTSATHPVLVDVQGRVHRIPRRRLVFVGVSSA